MEMQLSQRAILKTTLSKELTQAISLLQYSSIDLLSFIEEQSIQNPLIKIEKKEEFLDSYSSFSYKKDYVDPLEFATTKNENLTNYLTNQLLEIEANNQEKAVVLSIIQSLDNNGYLRESNSEIAFFLNVPAHLVEQAVNYVQQLEPAGVGARSLNECLSIQLRRKNLLTSSFEEVLNNHFQDFAYNKWNKIPKSIAKLQDLQALHDIVLSLNPKPGADYRQEDSLFIAPDYNVEQVDGNIVLKTNPQMEWQLKIETSYEEALKNKKDLKLYTYLKEKYTECQGLIKGLQMRKDTLNTVMLSIFTFQTEFFQYGPGHIKPLKLKDISAEIGVHESTVSRAVRNKYVQTSFGVFELKSFFTTGTQMLNDEEVSVTKVKQAIQKIIAEENCYKPLSDQKIQEILFKEHSFQISRRTVAKYREQLNILTSHLRKKYKVLEKNA